MKVLSWLAVMMLVLQASSSYGDMVLAKAEAAMAGKKVRGDEALFLSQGRMMQGKPPLFLRPKDEYFSKRTEFPYSLEYALWEMRQKQVALKGPLFKLSAPGKVDVVKASSLRVAGKAYAPIYVGQAQTVMALMKRSLECTPGFSEPDFGAVGYEYVSTHQAIAVLLAYRRGCLGEGALKRTAPIYVQRVFDELWAVRDQKLTDLQVERMAVLCMFAQCKAVPAMLITRLRTTQGKDGFWRFEENVKEIAMFPEHATALAYYAVAASSPPIR